MRGDEQRVVEAFCTWLEAAGWTVTREIDFADVLAERDGTRLYAEAKGRTAAMGLDVDTMYGQILRRMPLKDDPDVHFAIVVPEEAEAAVLRVPPRVRDALDIRVFVVEADNTVRASGGGMGSDLDPVDRELAEAGIAIAEPSEYDDDEPTEFFVGLGRKGREPTDYWEEIEQAASSPDRLRELATEIEHSAAIEPDERQHMLGRIQRYLDDQARGDPA